MCSPEPAKTQDHSRQHNRWRDGVDRAGATSTAHPHIATRNIVTRNIVTLNIVTGNIVTGTL